jgi:hypothetical protein
MSTPKYIRVAGQLYRQRDDAPEFIKHAGWLYKFAKTAVENEVAINALTKLATLSQKISEAIKDEQIAGLMKQAYGELSVLATKLAKGDFEEKSKALKGWGDLKKGLSAFGAQLQKANLPKLSDTMTKLVDASDKALAALQKAEGLGAEFGSPGGVLPSKEGPSVDWGETEVTAPAGGPLPSKKGPGVDWGEHAPQKKMQASATPGFLLHEGAWYRPLIPITSEAIAWATAANPVVVAQHKQFDPLVVHLLASGW